MTTISLLKILSIGLGFSMIFFKDYFKKKEAEKKIQDYYYKISQKKTKDIVQFLKSSLPQKSTKVNYQLSYEHINSKETYFTSSNIQQKLQKVADLMREHLLIEEPIKIITIKNIDAGKFEMIDDLNCIYINSDTDNQCYHQKLAILAHEMSHYYLMRKHKIIKDNEKENELLTEINTVYCGFGFFLLNGYKTKKISKGSENQYSKIGYIDLEVVKEAIIQTAYIRKQKPQWIIKNLNFLDKILLYDRFSDLKKEYRKAKKKTTHNISYK